MGRSANRKNGFADDYDQDDNNLHGRRYVFVFKVLCSYRSRILHISIPKNLWSSFLSWLKPPYIFVTINVIIVTIIVASSKYFKSAGDLYCEVKDVDMDSHVLAIFPTPVVVTDVDKSEVVCEEKEEDDKPLVSARFSHRKPVKVTSKGNKRMVPRVVKPKWHENTRKMMVTEEVKSTPLTSHSWSHETLRLATGEETRPVLRELDTFRDMTNNYLMSPTVTFPVKIRKEMSPSLEELNRKCEAFIKKGKEEMRESLRLDKDVDLQARLISF